LSPNIAWKELYELIKVGFSIGPFTVGPIIAAPLSTGRAVTKDWSFYLANTPGDINVSAIFVYYF